MKTSFFLAEFHCRHPNGRASRKNKAGLKARYRRADRRRDKANLAGEYHRDLQEAADYEEAARMAEALDWEIAVELSD